MRRFVRLAGHVESSSGKILLKKSNKLSERLGLKALSVRLDLKATKSLDC